MKKRTKKVIIACVVVILLMKIIVLSDYWIILPTTSSPGTLTLVSYGALSIKKVVIRHFIDREHISDYILELKIGLRHQQPQTYDLPKVSEGSIEVIIEMKDKDSSILNCSIDKEMYENGLLIYLTEDYNSLIVIDDFVYYDQYVYFVSGKERLSYVRKAGNSKWMITTEAPSLKGVTYESKGMGYTPVYKEWKTNEWSVSK